MLFSISLQPAVEGVGGGWQLLGRRNGGDFQLTARKGGGLQLTARKGGFQLTARKLSLIHI